MRPVTTTSPLQYDDFKDGAAVEKLIGVSLSGDYDEVECDVAGKIAPYRPATRIDPAEGGGVEDFQVRYGNHDLTDHLTPKAEDLLKTFLLEEPIDE